MTIKTKIKKLFGWMLLFAIVVSVGILMSFNASHQQNTICDHMIIDVNDETGVFFIDDTDIKPFLINHFSDSLTGKSIEQLQPDEIESAVERNPFVEDAETFVDMEGNIHINIIQKQPVARIINKYGVNYYIDKNAKKFPVNNRFTTRVPVISGNIEETLSSTDSIQTKILEDAFVLVQFLRGNELWNAETEQIYVNDNFDFEIIPKLGDHTIILGNVDDLENKFSKLELFYQQGLNYVGWDKYKTINVKFENQVVCTKKDTL